MRGRLHCTRIASSQRYGPSPSRRQSALRREDAQRNWFCDSWSSPLPRPRSRFNYNTSWLNKKETTRSENLNPNNRIPMSSSLHLLYLDPIRMTTADTGILPNDAVTEFHNQYKKQSKTRQKPKNTKSNKWGWHSMLQSCDEANTDTPERKARQNQGMKKQQ